MAYQRILPRVGEGNAGGFQNKAREFSGNAINARAGMHPGSTTTTEPPGKTVGGGMMAAGGGAMAGASFASLTGATAATETAAATTGALGLGLGA